jgi:hypothetical protein
MSRKSIIMVELFLLSAFVEHFYVQAEEPIGNTPMITINNCCASQIKSSDCGEDYKNISVILAEYHQKMENMLSTRTTGSNIHDCQDIQDLGHVSSGIYTIYPEGTVGFPVRCDMDTAGGGWTVIQRRVSNSDFYKTWTDYQIGFGNLSENFWLGNQQLHMITSQG